MARLWRRGCAGLVWLLLCAAGAAQAAGVDVRIRGLGPDETANAYALSSLLAYARSVDESKPPDKQTYDAEEVQRRFDNGADEIRAALQPFGWYNPAITGRLTGKAPDWVATYTVDAGPETDINTVKVALAGQGEHNLNLLALSTRTPFKRGTRLRHAEYDQYKSDLVRAAVAQGYLDAAFTTHELRVDPARNSADIDLVLDTGPRYYFGIITLDNEGLVEDARIWHYVKMSTNSPFNSDKALETQFDLSDLDYFSVVEIDPRKTEAGEDHHVPVTIALKYKPARVYSYSAGYGTDTGVRAGAGVQWRRINDNGDKFRFDIRASQRISTAVAEYKIPVGGTPGESYSLSVQGLSENVSDFREHLYSVGASRNYLGSDWKKRFYLTYARDAFGFGNAPGELSQLLTPGVEVSRSALDDPIFPHHGWAATADLHGAGDTLASNAQFLRFYMRLSGVMSLGPSVRFLARAEEGAIFADNFAFLPPSQRFFAGGDQSVRGYSYDSLGSRDGRGNLIGGKYLRTFSGELEYSLTQTYGVAVFSDAGGASDHPSVYLYKSVGIGFRYRAPFGSVAIDLAHPLETGATPVRLHLGVRVGL